MDRYQGAVVTMKIDDNVAAATFTLNEPPPGWKQRVMELLQGFPVIWEFFAYDYPTVRVHANGTMPNWGVLFTKLDDTFQPSVA